MAPTRIVHSVYRIIYRTDYQTICLKWKYQVKHLFSNSLPRKTNFFIPQKKKQQQTNKKPSESIQIKHTLYQTNVTRDLTLK